MAGHRFEIFDIEKWLNQVKHPRERAATRWQYVDSSSLALRSTNGNFKRLTQQSVSSAAQNSSGTSQCLEEMCVNV